MEAKLQTNKVFELLMDSDKRITVMQGGSRSGKTYNILIWFIVKLLQENGKTLTIVRQSLPSIKGTVLRDFVDILSRLNIYSEDNHNKTDQIYEMNGNIIEFVSADQPQKIRGRARDYLFCNEANELSYDAWMQLIMRTEGKIVVDYNPSDVSSWIYDMVIPRDDTDFYITTFRDNPFLPKELVMELERMKDADPNYWQIYGLGERGLSQDLIYTHYKTTENFPDDGEVVYGLDFGFNVPSAMVKVVFKEGIAFVKEMLYEAKLTTSDLIDRLKAMDLSRYDEIYCDAAEPKTIEELVRNGYNAKPANKDVTEGIRCVKGTPLTIHQESINLLKELKNYRWKTDRNGNKLDQPVKFNDHVCFVGNTMITTINGLKRIDSIDEGDYVLTSNGFRKVNKLFDNGMRLVEKYLMRFDTFEVTLVCTPNHKVKTNEGWKEISKLQSGMTVYLNNFIEVSHSDSSQENVISIMDQSKCTGMYGSKKLEESDQKDTTSTILMETVGTTESKTWNSLKEMSICQTTSKEELQKTQSGLPHSKNWVYKKHPNGIDRKMEGIGTENTQEETTLANTNIDHQSALCAKKTSHKKHHITNFAIQTAKLKHFEIGESWNERVYDLNVDETHEYFANGILVHNCDAMRYSIYSKLTIPSLTWGVI